MQALDLNTGSTKSVLKLGNALLRNTGKNGTLDDELNQQFRQATKGSGLQLMSDNGCHPTSVGFMKTSLYQLQYPQRKC